MKISCISRVIVNLFVTIWCTVPFLYSVLLTVLLACSNGTSTRGGGGRLARGRQSMIDKNSERVALQDARTIHDIASLDFKQYFLDGRTSWILANIVPDAASGTGTIPGGNINADNGVLVLPPNAVQSITMAGSWQSSASSASAQPASGRYFWYEPIHEKRILLPEDFYSPFTQGGTILFLQRPEKTGFEQFDFARMIFADWASDVSAAFAFHHGNPDLLDPVAQTVSVPQLMQLVSGQNPILAALAFRGLISKGLVQLDFARDLLLAAQKPLVAVLGYLTIIVPSLPGTYPLVDANLHALDFAGEATVRGLLLGAFAAALFHTRDKPILPRVKVIVARARQRLVAAGVVIENDVELTYMFDRMGI